MFKNKILNNRLKFIISILKDYLFDSKIIIEFNSYSPLFYQTLLGTNIIFKLEKDSKSEIVKILYFIVHTRLIGGIDLKLIRHKDNIYMINIEGLINQYKPNFDYSKTNKVLNSFLENYDNKTETKNYELKNFILKSLSKNTDLYYDTEIKIIAIPTCNRVSQLIKSIKEYRKNLDKYNLNKINIVIFDDSNLNNQKQLQKELNNLNISHIDQEKKNHFLNKLKSRSINKIKDLSEKEIIKYIDYTFGSKDLNKSYGRNRNFISYYFNNESIVTVDDDSYPKVLTYQETEIYKAIEKILDNGSLNLNDLEKNISNKNKVRFLDVNFLGNFITNEDNVPKYVKYSGKKDSDLYYSYLKGNGIKFNNLEESESSKLLKKHYSKNDFLKLKDKLTNDSFLYSEKENKNPTIKGLVIYLPKKSSFSRITIGDNLRIEDLIIGLNFSSYMKGRVFPVETNFSLYHSKNYCIKEYDLYNDLLGQYVFLLYYKYITNKEQHFDNFIEELYNKKIEHSEEIEEVIKFKKKYILDIFKEYKNQIKKNKKVIRKDIDLNKLFNDGNKVINNFSKSLFIWKKINQISGV